MIKSMTGYGSAKGAVEGLQITVELKSVNNRYLDVSVRLPRSFLFAEDAVKSAVQKHISRGKVDVFISVDSTDGGEMNVKVNEALLRGYLEALQHIAEEYKLPNDATALAVSRFPDVLTVEKKDLDADAISSGILEIAEHALEDFDAMRTREGAKLRDDVLAAIFADHIAVDEETVRLRSHMSQLKTMIDGSSPTGRKIDFLIQEFNREANTIGSKCQSSDIAHTVVDLKSEIEKIREQIQNIE